MLPLEIFPILSLQLPPGTLVISRELSSIYDDDWYHDFLSLKCPGKILWKQTTYKDRYIKYCQAGKLYKYKNGKILPCGDNITYSAHGELYIKGKLYDTGVIAIDAMVYIKEYEL